MDASRVDGLARVLESVAQDHQVVVLTHDERLPDACRRLRITTRILEVTRGEMSEVTVRTKKNPVDDYLDDARAILATDSFPIEARRRVIPGLCRNSIEAACIDATRARLLKIGIPFDQIEERIDAAGTLLPRMALALFGDSNQAGQVMAHVNQKYGSTFGDCVSALKSGTHVLIDDDPEALIRSTEKLAHAIANEI
jgi:hypothetical protein